MMKFIKLSSVIINTNNIKKITLQPNKYYIHFTNNIRINTSGISVQGISGNIYLNKNNWGKVD